MVRKQLTVLSALIMVAIPAEAVAMPSATLTPTFGAVSVESQDPGYLYRSLPGLQYVSWTDAAGMPRQRFIRSFHISADDGSLKSRVQYHIGGSMTDTANWRPALDATTGRELLYTSDYAKVNSIFRSTGGETVAIDEKADIDPAGRFVMRRATSDGGVHWTSTRASINLPDGTAIAGSDGRMYQRVIRLPDQSLVMPFYASHGQFGGEYKFAAHLLVSQDEGNSWRLGATVFKSDTNTYSESTVARRADGRLIMVTRYDVEQGGFHYARLASRVTTTAVADAVSLVGASWGPFTPVVSQGASPALHTMEGGVLMLAYGRPGNNITFSYDGGASWVAPKSLYSNAPTSGCTTGYGGWPCASLGSSGYLGIAVTSPRTAFILGDNCHTNWGCAGNYQYPHGRDDKLWFSTVVLG